MMDTDKLVTGMLDAVDAPMRRLHERIAKLEQRTENVPSYKGVWKAGQTYPTASLVTCHGGLWICSVPTDEKPGTGSSWQLCVKSHK